VRLSEVSAYVRYLGNGRSHKSANVRARGALMAAIETKLLAQAARQRGIRVGPKTPSPLAEAELAQAMVRFLKKRHQLGLSSPVRTGTARAYFVRHKREFRHVDYARVAVMPLSGNREARRLAEQLASVPLHAFRARESHPPGLDSIRVRTLSEASTHQDAALVHAVLELHRGETEIVRERPRAYRAVRALRVTYEYPTWREARARVKNVLLRSETRAVVKRFVRRLRHRSDIHISLRVLGTGLSTLHDAR
jgi:hypothetical protein